MNPLEINVKNKPDVELLKMAYQFDKWSPEMLAAVERELENRKRLPDDLSARKRQLVETERGQLSRGKPAGLFGQIIGWVTVFGILGIFIGYHYAYSKTTSKYTGEQYFTYNDTSRKSGTYLFYASLCFSAMAIIYKFSS
jgi:hypothetical protein